VTKVITYIFRKRLPHYHSIEVLFFSIDEQLSKKNQTDKIELDYSGASPMVLLKNLLGFKKDRERLYHITGDVHYMALHTGRTTILTIHDVKSATQGHFLKQFYIRLFWFWLPAFLVKRITVISEFTKHELVNIIPFAKKKIQVVHNPVNPMLKAAPFTFNTAMPNILLIGTKPNKNLERSFEALKNIPCQLTIIGRLSENQLMLLKKFEIDFVNKLNLNFDGVIECYKNCDLLCFASTYEGFGMPIIEAQAVGRPVVTSNLGAMKEVAADCALLVDPFDVDSIRCGINKIIGDPNLRHTLIQKGLENVERFSIRVITDNYIDIYNELTLDKVKKVRL